MEVLWLGTFKIVSDKTIRTVCKTSLKERCMCACVSVFHLNEKKIPGGKCYGFTQETREQ